MPRILDFEPARKHAARQVDERLVVPKTYRVALPAQPEHETHTASWRSLIISPVVDRGPIPIQEYMAVGTSAAHLLLLSQAKKSVMVPSQTGRFGMVGMPTSDNL